MSTHPVSERALIQRINRKLKPKGQMLKTARGHIDPRTGRRFIIDTDRNFDIEYRVDLEAKGRELGVLSAAETLAE